MASYANHYSWNQQFAVTKIKKSLQRIGINRYSKNKIKCLAGFILFSTLGMQSASAQLSCRSGAEIEPGYEGWRPNDDGTFSLLFGYINENPEEQPTFRLAKITLLHPVLPIEVNLLTSCQGTTDLPLKSSYLLIGATEN